jgi:hydrogenase expression/formation protein HypE
MTRLPPGKIPIDILKEVVFKNLGAERKEVTVGPQAGIDGAVIDLGEKSLVVSMDPITGAVERIGWLAVNVNANDIATFGVEPAFLFSCMLLPEGADRGLVEAISTQMSAAAKALGVAIVGGHCESTPRLAHPIVVCCIMGMTEKGCYVTAGGAQTGDKLILTKSAGIEGTAILATDRETDLQKTLSASVLERAKNYWSQISVVKDALTACRTGGVHAMHDPTEGGVAGGVHEVADASSLGVRVYEDAVTVKSETAEICRYFKMDPLQLISSGALLISADPQSSDEIVKNLAVQGIQASVIGEFLENVDERVLIRKGGVAGVLRRPVSDSLWAALVR